MIKVRHTVVFTWRETTTEEQKKEVIKRLSDMGEWLQNNLAVTDWVVAEHISETFKAGRAHLLQDCVFQSRADLESHAHSEVHFRVVELTSQVCDWMTIDTNIEE